jgi:hypothetical protein
LVSTKMSVIRISVLSIPIAMIAVFILSSSLVSAVGTKTIVGTVYDESGNPLAGATVTVTMKSGETVHGVHSDDPTLSDGYYLITFGETEWAVGDDIVVVAVKAGNGGEATSNSVADDFDFQIVDVSFQTAIPQFSGLVGAFAAAGLVGAIAVVAVRKGKPAL